MNMFLLRLADRRLDKCLNFWYKSSLRKNDIPYIASIDWIQKPEDYSTCVQKLGPPSYINSKDKAILFMRVYSLQKDLSDTVQRHMVSSISRFVPGG